MPVLHLDNVPEEIYMGLEQLALRRRSTPPAQAVALLADAVRRAEAEESARFLAELEEIRRHPIVPTPGTPDSVDLIREDRGR
jgi:hypothetical protein